MDNFRAIVLVVVAAQFCAGCSTPLGDSSTRVVKAPTTSVIEDSYLSDKQAILSQHAFESPDGADSIPPKSSSDYVRRLESLVWEEEISGSMRAPNQLFSESDNVTVVADNMPVVDFLHYVFGDLLKVNYIIDPSILPAKGDAGDSITLNLVSAISSRRLFDLTSELIGQRGINVKFDSDTFFFHSASVSELGSRMIIGIGREETSVPSTAQKILQVVPLNFGIKVSVERTLRTLTTAKITPDYEQSSLFVEGSREQVIQVLDLIKMLDTPAVRGRNIGIIELNHISPSNFAVKVKDLLGNEGIDLGLNGVKSNVVLVPLPSISAVAIFATDMFLMSRVNYWAGLLDIPGDGPTYQYFVYSPKFSRSKDLGDSVSRLLGLNAPDAGGASLSGATTGNAPSRYRTVGADGGDIKLVVDEKANVLVFYAIGSAYRDLLPLLRKLDVMPKQVMIDMVIAEVSLKDEFKHGVEWALSRGEVTLTTQGAFGAGSIGGLGLLVNGSEGPLTANFLTTNSLVKVLSNPTIMVRDGAQASISVGSSISVTGQTTQDPINGDRQTSSAEYRQTGIDVSIQPTVNAQGIVAMEINQSISNTVPGSTGSGGNPDIFERSLSTEVLASSGQSVMLAGLISEDTSAGGSGTPGFQKLPVIGSLFKSKQDVRNRTELVMLITPRVMTDLADWGPLLSDFERGLKFLGISGSDERSRSLDPRKVSQQP